MDIAQVETMSDSTAPACDFFIQKLVQYLGTWYHQDDLKTLRLLNKRWCSVVSGMIKDISIEVERDEDIIALRDDLQRLPGKFPWCCCVTLGFKSFVQTPPPLQERGVDRMGHEVFRVLAAVASVPLQALVLDNLPLAALGNLSVLAMGSALGLRQLSLNLALHRCSNGQRVIDMNRHRDFEDLLRGLPQLRELTLTLTGFEKNVLLPLVREGQHITSLQLHARSDAHTYDVLHHPPELHHLAALTNLRSLNVSFDLPGILQVVAQLPELRELKLGWLYYDAHECVQWDATQLSTLTKLVVCTPGCCNCVWWLVGNMKDLAYLDIEVPSLPDFLDCCEANDAAGEALCSLTNLTACATLSLTDRDLGAGSFGDDGCPSFVKLLDNAPIRELYIDRTWVIDLDDIEAIRSMTTLKTLYLMGDWGADADLMEEAVRELTAMDGLLIFTHPCGTDSPAAGGSRNGGDAGDDNAAA